MRGPRRCKRERHQRGAQPALAQGAAGAAEQAQGGGEVRREPGAGTAHTGREPTAALGESAAHPQQREHGCARAHAAADAGAIKAGGQCRVTVTVRWWRWQWGCRCWCKWWCKWQAVAQLAMESERWITEQARPPAPCRRYSSGSGCSRALAREEEWR